MIHAERSEQWRAHFARCEEEQLKRFPLLEIETPLERALYQVAANDVREHLPPADFYLERLFAFEADEITRRVFFDLLGKDERRPFCLRTEEWSKVFNGDFAREIHSPTSRCWHRFKPYSQANFDRRKTDVDAMIEDYPAQEMFIRAKGIVRAPRSGYGWTDYWHWNGNALVLLRNYSRSWIS